MKIPLYLAQTAAEFASAAQRPPYLAWMACHFSPYGTGLTNLPFQLPQRSLLILNDRTPVHGHDPNRIKESLEEIIQEQDCCGVLLDFQRPNCPDTVAIVTTLLTLSCPVCVSDLYAQEPDSPVFLPPVPLTTTVEEHLAPWQGREIWLETALENTLFIVTDSGSKQHQLQAEGLFPFCDKDLHCHYRIEQQDDSVHFYLARQADDLEHLLEKASTLGVTKAIGLWQEFKNNE